MWPRRWWNFMTSSRTCLRPVIRPGAVLFLALLCYLAPLRTVGAFLLAMTIHELGHMGAIALCGGRLRGLCLGARGAVIAVEGLSSRQELLCALAGPGAGLLLPAFGRWLPMTALMALGHSLYNLLPVYPLDGGRALYCALSPMGERGWRQTQAVGLGTALCLGGLGLYGTLGCQMGPIPALFGGIFFLRGLALWWEK
mgnify:CR=1 FL=1